MEDDLGLHVEDQARVGAMAVKVGGILAPAGIH